MDLLSVMVSGNTLCVFNISNVPSDAALLLHVQRENLTLACLHFCPLTVHAAFIMTVNFTNILNPTVYCHYFCSNSEMSFEDI